MSVSNEENAIVGDINFDEGELDIIITRKNGTVEVYKNITARKGRIQTFVDRLKNKIKETRNA